MATNKNITMKQFNGTDYDTLYPKTIASQVADVYSKNETLTTAVKGIFGLSGTAVPNDVFSFLGQFNEHWWELRPENEFVDNHGTKQNVVVQETSSNNTKVAWYYGSSYTFNTVTGEYTIVNPSSTTVQQAYTSTQFEPLKGHYCIQGSSNTGRTMFYFPASAVASQDHPSNYTIVVNSCDVYVGVYMTYSPIYYHSKNKNAYSEKDGYTYLGVPFNNLVPATKIELGSYIGTGEFGPDSPNMLTFERVPKLVLLLGMLDTTSTYSGFVPLFGTGTEYITAIAPNLLTTEYAKHFGFGLETNSTIWGKRSSDMKSIYWHSGGQYSDSSSASASGKTQANAKDWTYFYIVIF